MDAVFVTLPFTVNEALKGLSSRPILKQKLILVVIVRVALVAAHLNAELIPVVIVRLALVAAHLNAEVILVVIALGTVPTPCSHPLGSRSPPVPLRS